MRTCLPILMLAAALLCGILLNPSAASQPGLVSSIPQEETAPVPRATEDLGHEGEPEKIHPGPWDITERIAIFVFLGWLWLSILVLIYVLRLKIRESDRLHEFAYFDTDKDTPQRGT